MRLRLGIALLAAAQLAVAQEPAQKEDPQPTPAKTEEPATAAGGQSAGASTVEVSGGTGFAIEAVVGVVGWVAAGLVAASASKTDSATSH